MRRGGPNKILKSPGKQWLKSLWALPTLPQIYNKRVHKAIVIAAWGYEVSWQTYSRHFQALKACSHNGWEKWRWRNLHQVQQPDHNQFRPEDFWSDARTDPNYIVASASSDVQLCSLRDSVSTGQASFWGSCCLDRTKTIISPRALPMWFSLKLGFLGYHAKIEISAKICGFQSGRQYWNPHKSW